MIKPSIKQPKYAGLTLIEILVVASLIIILSFIILANYEFGGYHYRLQRSAYRIAQDARRVEEMAIFIEEFEGIVPAGGYGINFDLSYPDRYILFADDNENGIYDPAEDRIMEEIELRNEIEIVTVCVGTSCPIGSHPLNVVFTPPDPIVTIKSSGVSTGGELGNIVLQSRKTNESISVYFNSAGLIEVRENEDPGEPPD